MRIWPKKREQAPEGGFPPLKATFRYAQTATGHAFVETVFLNRSATDLRDAIERDRAQDRMISLGIADTEQEIIVFPARSIMDVKIRLATPEELGP